MKTFLWAVILIDLNIDLKKLKCTLFSYIPLGCGTPGFGRIRFLDGEWEEINMGPQSSIEVISDKSNWYILSSDGLKNS